MAFGIGKILYLAGRGELADLEVTGKVKRRIAHAKLRAEVLRKQLNCRTVPRRVRLGQILNCLHQQVLAFHVTRVVSCASFASTGIGNYRNRQDFGHVSLAIG